MSQFSTFSELLCEAAAEADPATGRTKLQDIIARLIENAVSGDLRAIMLIADQLDGASVQEAIFTFGKVDAPDRAENDAVRSEVRQKELVH